MNPVFNPLSHPTHDSLPDPRHCHTAGEYVRSVYTKVQVHIRSGVVAKAVREGLVGEL